MERLALVCRARHLGPTCITLKRQTTGNEKTTIDLFNTIIVPHVVSRRLVLGQPLAPAIIFADAFAAHWTPAVKKLVSELDNVAYICVPESLTHLFQPLDLGIIAAIKNSVMRRKDEFCEAEVRTAVRENRGVILSKSRPVLRERITMFIKQCLADPDICAEHCCEMGFARAGILKALFGEGHPDIDDHVAPSVCAECGEIAFARQDMPSCACFADVSGKLLCDGCFDNHSTLCVLAE